MIDTVANLLFRCRHRHLTRPITPAVRPDAEEAGTYVVCLDCGKRFAYDWTQMRLGRPLEGAPPDEPRAIAQAAAAPRKKKVRLALLGSAVPLAVLAARIFRPRRRRQAVPDSTSR